MQLEDFFDYKNKFMEDVLTSETIVKMLDHDLPISDSHKLVYKQVFPYEYLPDTVEEAKTFICVDVDVQRSMNKTFLLPVVYVWVFSHKTRLRLLEGGVLVDKLVSEIAKKMNGSRMYGIGELDLTSVKRFAPLTDYQGKVMVFNAKEWNNPSPSKHIVPTNRKSG